MKSGSFLSSLLIAVFPLFLSLQASEDELKVATGFSGGTYYHVGNSLATLGLNVSVLTTRGTVQNIKLVAEKKADLGMTQMDVLLGRALKSDKIRKAVKILLPVYNEEVHVVALNEITDFSGLKGKRVSIGPSGSGIQGTSQILLKLAKIDKISVNKSQTMNALQKLISREIDAMFIVAGSPVELLAGLPPQAGKKIHLLAMSDKDIAAAESGLGYRRVKIAQKDYTWLNGDVNTVAVNTAIIARADLDDATVTKLVAGAFKSKGALQGKHTKWKELDAAVAKDYLAKYKDYFHPAAAKVISGL